MITITVCKSKSLTSTKQDGIVGSADFSATAAVAAFAITTNKLFSSYSESAEKSSKITLLLPPVSFS